MPHKTRRRKSVSRRLKIIMGVCAFLVVGLVMTALTLDRQSAMRDNAQAAEAYNRAVQNTRPSTPEPSAEPRPEGAIPSLIAGPDDITISVLGDSTGNEAEEWAGLWAKHLTKYGTVTLHMWDGDADDWNPQPVVYPGGEKQITIWNGSKSGVNYAYPLERIEQIQPEKPTFTILSLGHNIGEKQIDAGAQELTTAINDLWGEPIPTVVTLQNPAQGDRAQYTAASVAYLRNWAGAHGHTLIDVNSAFTEAGDIPSLLMDEVHPNDAGQQIWLEQVIEVLG